MYIFNYLAQIRELEQQIRDIEIKCFESDKNIKNLTEIMSK